MATAAGKKVTLMSSDGEVFDVEETVAMEMQMINLMIEDDCANDKIPLPNVTGKALAKVIEYCKKHAEQKQMEEDNKADKEEQLKVWDAEFVDVDTDTLFHLIMAANYLEIKSLMDLACQKVADMVKGKSVEELRKTFQIENDFTPEEEEEIRRENAWAFE